MRTKLDIYVFFYYLSAVALKTFNTESVIWEKCLDTMFLIHSFKYDGFFYFDREFKMVHSTEHNLTEKYYTFIAFWWGKYENLFTQEYHIPWGQRQRGIWYSWVNTFSYFLNPHGINVLLYRMKPRKHIHVKYCGQAYFKSIETLSQTFKNHIHNNKEIQDQYPKENNMAN